MLSFCTGNQNVPWTCSWKFPLPLPLPRPRPLPRSRASLSSLLQFSAGSKLILADTVERPRGPGRPGRPIVPRIAALRFLFHELECLECLSKSTSYLPEARGRAAGPWGGEGTKPPRPLLPMTPPPRPMDGVG